MSVELILTVMWQMGLLGLLVLAGYLYRDRKSYLVIRDPYRSRQALLPDRISMLRKHSRSTTYQRFRSFK